MRKFTVLKRDINIGIGLDERKADWLVLKAGDRLKINPRDHLTADGKHVVHTMVIRDGKSIHEDIHIPVDAVTANTLKNFEIN